MPSIETQSVSYYEDVLPPYNVTRQDEQGLALSYASSLPIDEEDSKMTSEKEKGPRCLHDESNPTALQTLRSRQEILRAKSGRKNKMLRLIPFCDMQVDEGRMNLSWAAGELKHNKTEVRSSVNHDETEDANLYHEVKKLRAEIEAKNKKIDDGTKEMKQLELVNLKILDITDLEDKVVALEDENSQLAGQIANAKSKVVAFESTDFKSFAAMAERGQAHDNLERRKRELTKSNNRVKELGNEIEKMASDVRENVDLREKIQTLEDSIKRKSTEDATKRREEDHKRIIELKVAKADSYEAKNRVLELENECNNRVKELGNEIEKMTLDVRKNVDLREKIQTLEDSIKRKSTEDATKRRGEDHKRIIELKVAKADSYEAKSRVLELENELNEIVLQNQIATREAQNHQEERALVESQIPELEEQIRDLKTKLKDLKQCPKSYNEPNATNGIASSEKKSGKAKKKNKKKTKKYNAEVINGEFEVNIDRSLPTPYMVASNDRSIVIGQRKRVQGGSFVLVSAIIAGLLVLLIVTLLVCGPTHNAGSATFPLCSLFGSVPIDKLNEVVLNEETGNSFLDEKTGSVPIDKLTEVVINLGEKTGEL